MALTRTDTGRVYDTLEMGHGIGGVPELNISYGPDHGGGNPIENVPGVMALANFALPADSPNKITSEMAALVRRLVDNAQATACSCRNCQLLRDSETGGALRDAIESLLAPEGIVPVFDDGDEE